MAQKTRFCVFFVAHRWVFWLEPFSLGPRVEHLEGSSRAMVRLSRRSKSSRERKLQEYQLAEIWLAFEQHATGEPAELRGAGVPEALTQLGFARRQGEIGDGPMDYERFQGLMKDLYEERSSEDWLLIAFEQMDVDGSGTISEHDLSESLGRSGMVVEKEYIKKMISKYDSEGAGELGIIDFSKVMKELRLL